MYAYACVYYKFKYIYKYNNKKYMLKKIIYIYKLHKNDMTFQMNRL